MADHSSIEWTDATWNPITGCSIVSPGCTNCYAMKLAGTRLKHIDSRKGLTRDTKAGPVWTGEVRLNRQWLYQPFDWKKPRRIFVCAHGDLFAENVPDEWIDKVFAIMALAPQHTFQVLTKRAKRMREYMTAARERIAIEAMHSAPIGQEIGSVGLIFHPHNRPSTYFEKWPLPNVWLGVSAERQQEADERVPELLGTPAAIRFVSAEPLLGPIDFRKYMWPVHGWWSGPYRSYQEAKAAGGECGLKRQALVWAGSTFIDWIIVGGESGPNARPMHPAWARLIRDQCQTAGTAFFFKQWGEWAPQIGAVDGWTIDDDPEISRFDHREWEEDQWGEVFRPMWCDFSDGNYDEEQTVSRIGKRRAGRLLDGVEHNAMPEAR